MAHSWWRIHPTRWLVESQLDEAQLRVESAKADSVASEKGFEIQQSENDSKIRQAQLKLELARLALDQWEKGEKVQKLQDIELDLDKTAQDLKRLKEKAANSLKLFEQGFLSKNELDLDNISLREAEAARKKEGAPAPAPEKGTAPAPTPKPETKPAG